MEGERRTRSRQAQWDGGEKVGMECSSGALPVCRGERR